MATVLFASPDDVVSKDHLPGFHTIVSLDAVLSKTHALLDMYHQDLKDKTSGMLRDG